MGDVAPGSGAPMRGPRIFFHLLTSSLLFAGWASVGAQTSQSSDRLQFLLGGSMTNDSNVFRVPDGVDPPQGRSDTISSGYVGLRVDQPFSLQRVQLNITQSVYRYDKFSDLDYDALNYAGTWFWSLTPRFNGTVTANQSESLVPFSDFVGRQANKRKNNSLSANLDGHLFGGWHLLLGIGRTRQLSSIPVLSDADYEMEYGEAGLRYLALSGSSWAVVTRRNEGEYVNRPFPVGGVDNRFVELLNELRVSWTLTGQSKLEGTAGWVDRHHPHLTDRDYVAPIGSLVFSWTPTGKLAVSVSARQDVAAANDPFSKYTRRTNLSVGPSWTFAARTVAHAILGRSHVDYRDEGPLGPRKDDTDSV